MDVTPFKNANVQNVFETYPVHIRQKLGLLRELIFSVASETEGVAELEEVLKWGEPAYLTVQSKSGSTIRMGGKPLDLKSIFYISIAKRRWLKSFGCCFQMILSLKGIAPLFLKGKMIQQ